MGHSADLGHAVRETRMSLLEGRTAIVTGAGRGLGRAHALMLAKHGANVIVNDLGSSAAGEGADQTPAQEVVSEIEKMGGKAAINTSDVSDWKAAQEMVQQAIDTFGGLDSQPATAAALSQ